MHKLVALTTALGCFLTTSALLADPLPVVGQWRALDEEGKEGSIVEIYEQGGKIFGKVISLKEPLDENGKPKVCSKCEGSDKNKPVLGLVIIKNLSKDGDGYSGGTITDTRNGKVYGCEMQAIEGGKKLKLRGYWGLSLLGKSVVWPRK